jgi:type I protein arginine methyltransferase
MTSAQLGAPNSADIIVSEWMGYALLFESMLESVLLARNKWLKPGGAVLPDQAIIHVAAGDLAATTLDFWDDVYGFSLANVKEELLEDTQGHPIVTPVPASSLLSQGTKLKTFDLATMLVEDIDFTESCDVEISRSGTCHCIVLWFDTPFSERFCSEQPVTLTTSPQAPQTHWVQTVFLLKRAVDVQVGEHLHLRMSFAKGKRHRSLDITAEVSHVSLAGQRTGMTNAYVMEVSAADPAPKPSA